jgi:hypothetical protein
LPFRGRRRHDAITGRITNATAPAEVASVLADVSEAIWVELAEPDFVPLTPGERALKAQFVLRHPLGGGPLCWLPAGERICLDDPIPVGSGLKGERLPLLGPSLKPDGGATGMARAASPRAERRWIRPHPNGQLLRAASMDECDMANGPRE